MSSTPTPTASAIPSLVPPPVYYDTFTAGMSTIGIFNTMLGFLVMGILGPNLFVLVAMLSSIGAAVGYGLAWIPWFPSGVTSTQSLITVSVIADIFWLMQEASLSMYSFLIVRKLVRGHTRESRIYQTVFWFLELSICACRVPIMISRAEVFRNGDTPELETRINFYHTGFFVSIALCESWNAYFLLKKFYKARRHQRIVSRSATPKGRLAVGRNLYSQLARSSEIRLASLATIGITRSITFTVLDGPVSQLDNFVAAIETLFPTLFLIDILASRLTWLEQRNSEGGAGRAYPGPHSAEFQTRKSKILRDEEAIPTELKPVALRSLDHHDSTESKSGNFTECRIQRLDGDGTSEVSEDQSRRL